LGRPESEILAAQDKALQTKYCARKILLTDRKCRLCQQFDETIEHIIATCQILAEEEYIKRHDRVCVELHFNICKEMWVKLDKKHWPVEPLITDTAREFKFFRYKGCSLVGGSSSD
jgi:hypothetical protein